MENRSNAKYFLLLVAIVLIGGIGVWSKFYFSSKSENASGKEIVKQNNPVTKSLVSFTSEKSDFSRDSSVYAADSITLLSAFESGETASWQGNGVTDEKIFYEGLRSLSLVSTDHKPVTVFLEKPMDLSSMEFIEFMLHVSDTEAYELATIDFADTDFKSYYRYSLTNLKNGWNLIQIPKDKFIETKAKDAIFDWTVIQKVRFTAISRPSSIFLARIDMLRSINDSANYLSDWRTLSPQTFLSLFVQDGKNKVMARSIGASTAVMKDLEDINDFMFVSSISPQSSGRSGLFIRGNYNNGYGYYFLIGGDKKNTWEIQKRNKDGWTKADEKIQGVIQNVVFSKDKTYWLRVDAKGDIMEFLFSFDGQKYEKFGEIVDNEFRGGGVGLAVFDAGAWSLFDNFQFKKY
jgi:uncharacterized protein (UPF0333 family)